MSGEEGSAGSESVAAVTADTSSSSQRSTGSNSKLLCGYLNKLSGKGPLRGFKKRWFIHSSSDCKLKYYRAKGDLVPLGEIDIRRATFTITPVTGSHSSSLVFSIVTLDKEFVLEGVDQETSLFWIKELQRLRKEYIVNLASDFGIKLTIPSLDDGVGEPQITEVKNTRSNSRFYTNEDLSDELNQSVILQPKRSVTDDSLNRRLSRAPAAAPSPSGFTSALFSRVRNRAESLTRGNGQSKGAFCEKCREKDDQLITISDDLTAVENELQATREVVHLLQRQLDVIQSEKSKLQEVVREGSGGRDATDALLSSLSDLEVEAGNSQAKINSMQRMFDRLNNEYENVQEEKKKLTEEISVLRDTVEAKDKTVINLTNEIFDLEANGHASGLPLSPPPSHHRPQSLVKVESPEIDQLKDSLQAYMMQNEFLNQEVVAVNELRLMSEKKTQELQLQSYEWEAKCCQMQSKLLSLLKEINQSMSASQYEDDKDPQSKKKEVVFTETTIDLVKRLLDDISLNIPLSWQKGNRARNEGPTITAAAKFNHQEYDDLGFSHRRSKYSPQSKSFNGSGNDGPDENEGPDEADLMQEELAKRRKEIAGESAAVQADSQAPVSTKQSWKSRWDSYVGSLAGSSDLQRSQELKFLLRSGIPREYRCKIWKGLIALRVRGMRERLGPDYYKRLLMQQASNGKPNSAAGGRSSQTKSYDPHVKQIELDLLRTLPNNKHFESLESDGTCRLRRVLTAYSRHNPHVGYCQGLNRLAAVSLLFMPEEEAFWTLVAIIEHLMPPDYYSMNLLGAHVDQHVFRDLLSDKLPKVHEVLEKFGVEVSLFSWFLTCFVDNIPVDVYLRIWDVFLYEGNKVLFRFALAFFKLHEEEIIATTDSVQVNTLIRTLGEIRCDVRALCRIAFTFLNPFPMNRVRTKRQHYAQVVRSELERLDQIRRSLPSYDASFTVATSAASAVDPDDNDSD